MAEYVILHWQKAYEHSKAPTRATPYSAGTDVYSAFEYCIPRKGKAIIDIGLHLIIPLGYYGRIASKSGNSVNHSLEVGAGAVDPDFTGIVHVVLYNHGDEDYLLPQGKEVAQVILEKIAFPILREITTLPATERGARGLGLTSVSSHSFSSQKVFPIMKELKTQPQVRPSVEQLETTRMSPSLLSSAFRKDI